MKINDLQENDLFTELTSEETQDINGGGWLGKLIGGTVGGIVGGFIGGPGGIIAGISVGATAGDIGEGIITDPDFGVGQISDP